MSQSTSLIFNGGTVPGTRGQSDWAETNPLAESYIKNKPDLSDVATSGDYDDLSNKPTIPAAQVNSDWNSNSGVSQILNKPTIPTVDQSYSASSTNAQSGTAVAQAIENSKELPDFSNKANLYLRVNSSGTGILWTGTPTPSFQSYKSTTTSVTIDAGDYTFPNVAASLTATISAGEVFVGSMVLQLADFSGNGQTVNIELGYKAGTIATDSYDFSRLAGEGTYVIPLCIDNQYGSSPVSVGLIINGTVFASTTFTISLNGLTMTV